MSISLKTHKLLWGRSGNRCAFEDCRKELIADETETDDESIIGDEAHIIARNIEGPRGNHPLPIEEIDRYDNLILLCRIHHKLIDDQPIFYSVEKLLDLKKSHERWVKETLKFDFEKNKEELSYATYVDEIFNMLEMESWDVWTSSLLSHGQPKIYSKRLKQFEKVPNYIISRFWAGLYEELEKSILNLKNVLNDLIKVFYRYSEDYSDKYPEESNYPIFTEKFYKNLNEWNPERYQELLEEYEYHVALVADLTLELTRAANFVIENVRKVISPKFREEEGKLLVVAGPFMDFSWKTYKVEYSREEKESSYPYSGLKKFMEERVNRDLAFGQGYNKQYFLTEFF